MHRFLTLLICFQLLSCTEPEQQNSYMFHYTGSRDMMMREQDFSARIDLDSLKSIDGLMALGPIENMKGEITVVDGVVYTATIRNGQSFYKKDSLVKAVFLAYGKSDKYQEVKIQANIDGLKEIETFVQEQAIKKGLNLEKSFPFYMEAEVAFLNYHIIFKEGKGIHQKKEHQKAKKRFQLVNSTVKVVGVWANSQEEGIYTHPGSRIHLHFANEESLASGHVDQIRINSGSALFLPEN